jgi:hypothetical protein
MAIDPNIPLKAFDFIAPQQQIVKTPDELQQDINVADQGKLNVEATRLKNEEMRKDAQDRFEMQRMLQETGGDTDKVILRMMTVNPKLALELKESVSKQQKAEYESLLARQKQAQGVLETGSMILQGAKDEPSYQRARQQLAQIVPGIAQSLPPQYDEQMVQAAVQQGWSAAETNKLRTQALEDFGKGDQMLALARQLSTTRNQDERDQTFKGFKTIGGQDLVAQQFDREWSPLALQRDKQILEQALTTKKAATPTSPPNSQSKPMLLNGQRVPVDYVPGDGVPGKYFYKGQDVSDQVREIPPQAATSTTAMTADDTDQIVQMLADGRMVPSQLTKRGNYNQILARTDRAVQKQGGKGYDAAKANINFEAAKRFITSLNGSQQLRFKQLAESVVPLLDDVVSAAAELKQGGIQKWNAAKRDTILNVYGNTPYSAAAVRYNTAVTALEEEFAQIVAGGYAPTESAWRLAKEQINKNYGLSDLTASLDEVRRIMNFRIRAIGDSSPTTLDGGPDVAGTRAAAAEKRMQGTIPPDAVPPGLAKLKDPTKPVIVNKKDKSGKVVAKVTIYPDGSASEQVVK